MISLKIPIENKVSVLIGDIYVNCQVRFRPNLPSNNTMEAIYLDQLNARLGQLGYEIATEISQKLETRLKAEEKGPQNV